MEIRGVAKVVSSEVEKVSSGNRVHLECTIFNKKMEANGKIMFNIFYPSKVRPHTFVPGDFYLMEGKINVVYYNKDGGVKSFPVYDFNTNKGALLKFDREYMEKIANYDRVKSKFASASKGERAEEEEDEFDME
jgi:hypothetical protein